MSGLIVARWRQTGWGGITHPIAIQRIGTRLKVIKPVWQEYSRTQRHGTWYYYTDQVDVLLYLEQSNTDKRSVHISKCRLPAELCRLIKDVAGQAWLAEEATVRQVEKILEELVIAETL